MFTRIKNTKKTTRKIFKRFSKNKKQRLAFNNHRLQNSSIQSNLKRGYVILKNKQDKVLSNLEMAKKSDEIKACFVDGELLLREQRGEDL